MLLDSARNSRVPQEIYFLHKRESNLSPSSDIFEDDPSDLAYHKDHVPYSALKILSVVYVKRTKMEIPSTIHFIKKIADLGMT